MNATCLVNSHNYRDYVVDAVRSVLEQTRPFERVVVVDDGSTDGSAERLRDAFAGEPCVELIAKPNAGQLSCFNAGIDRVETGLVFFLDADDRYQPGYLERAIQEYASRPEVDFLSVAPRPTTGVMHRKKHRTRNHGIGVLATLLGGEWLGERTSCLSMRASVARALLPCPYESDWRTRADDVLVLGAAIAGAYKRHLELPLVDYRIHERNAFVGNAASAATKLRHSLAVNRLIHWCGEQSGLQVDRLASALHREFRTRERPTWSEWLSYLQMSWAARLPLSTRLRHLGAMTDHYSRERRRGEGPVAPQDASRVTEHAAARAA